MISSFMFYVVTHFAAPCAGGSFLGFPKWYKYVDGRTVAEGVPGAGSCAPQVTHLSDIWLIVAAFVEILLRIGGLLAVVFVIYGGVQYITSQGEPNKTNQARQTVINALIGLTISIGATTLLTFFAGRFK
ncbi:MAG: pilin [Candidatus Saccharimonadales bacterium]